jgi:purine-binding chemotaxis protein CheW
MSPTQTTLPILLARISGIQVGFAASAVRKIVRAAAIAPLAGAPAIIEGAINLHGRIVPVVNVRQRLDLPAAGLTPEQFFIVLHASDRLIAVRVDDVDDMIELAETSLESPASISPVLERLQGVAAIDSGALVIYDIDGFLTQAEQEALGAVNE